LADQLQMDTAALLRLLQPALPKASTTRPRSRQSLQRQVLPPVHLAISLILQQPSLADWVSDKAWLSAVDLPEKELLVDISDKLHQHPEMTTGELLADYEGSPRHALIATLAARTASISGESIKTEFEEVLAHLKQQSTEQCIQELIEKAKKSQLNLQEKRKLQTLLSTIKGDTNDRS